MKQSAAKTLGVAALGVAFAAAGAGAASAAAPNLPDAAGALNSVTAGLPLEQASSVLPAGGPEAVSAAQNALGSGLTAAQPVVEKVAQGATEGDPVTGLLGGLPAAKSLPTQGLPVGSGLPALG
ncbi:ATP-binding protein [Streptomyces sp. NPDC050264]|uniref:ATP-binding protein n=1 Tax=Streptomyces sp. NPDC050264 TaxID=3155038 RepID=UPI0034153EFC